jgi:hypothetical protein
MSEVIGKTPVVFGYSKTGVEILRDLWRAELDILLTTIANDRRNHEEIHRSAQHVSSDYHGRFLTELLQNANDQARLVSLKSSTVKILRTNRFVALSNEGQPFDARKVKGITSIFLSDKPPDLCIGNKGIGFKAVFEIAEEAEIHSAASGANLAQGCSIAFRIVREPLDDPELRAEFTRIAQALLDRSPDRVAALRLLRPDIEPMYQMLLEAGKAAWFKFPLPADHARLIAHLAGAGLGRAFLERCQTIVLLVVRRAPMCQPSSSIKSRAASSSLESGKRNPYAEASPTPEAISPNIDRSSGSHWWLVRRTLGAQARASGQGNACEKRWPFAISKVGVLSGSSSRNLVCRRPKLRHRHNLNLVASE